MSCQTISNDVQNVASEIKVDEQSSVLSNELSSSVQTDQKHKVKAVVLRTDGSAVEIIYDANPSKNTIKEILGVSPTIIGEWKRINVVLLRGKYTSLTAPLNKHKLRFPFHARKFYGDILLYRVNNEGVLDNFTLLEYEAFSAEQDTDAECNSTVSYGTSKEMEEEELKEMTNTISPLIEKQFIRRHGRKPSAWETRTLANTAIQAISQIIGPDERLEEYSDEEHNIIARRSREENRIKWQKASKSGAQKQSPLSKKMATPTKTPSKASNASNGVESEEAPLPDSLRRDIAEAFEIIRAKGRQDACYLADLVSETFYEINGREAELQEIAGVFKRVKEQLAEEANDELLDSEEHANDIDATMASSLITPQKVKTINEESRQAIKDYASVALTAEMADDARMAFIRREGREPSLKEFEDLLVSLITTKFVETKFGNESDNGFLSNETEAITKTPETKSERKSSSDKKPVKFFSPVRGEKTPKVEKSGLNSVDRKLMERAVKHFHSIYQRAPSEEESAKLCKFLTTGNLPSIGSDDEKEDAENANPNVKKLTFNESDDDNDSEYNPEKDITCNEEKDAAEESDNMADLVNEDADINIVK